MNSNNIYVVCNNSKKLFAKLQFYIKKRYGDKLLILDKDDMVSTYREMIFSKFYSHISPSKITSSIEYLYSYNHLESCQIKNLLKSICKHNEGNNIFIHGNFFYSFNNLEWITELNNFAKIENWKINFLFLSESNNIENYQNKLVNNEKNSVCFFNRTIKEIKKDTRVIKIYNFNELNNFLIPLCPSLKEKYSIGHRKTIKTIF